MKFSAVLKTHLPVKQTLVEEKLDFLKNGLLQAKTNIFAESRLPKDAWNDLISRLISAPADLHSIQTSIRNFCRHWTLNGPHAIKSSGLYGRATTVRQLADVFHPYFGSPLAARAHVRSMIKQPLSKVRWKWQSWPIGNHVMWSTLDLSGRAPFEFVPPTAGADYVRSSLGLSRVHAGIPLILLEYLVPHSAEPTRIPTIADAYAAGQWSYYFRPAVETEHMHGWTMPWDDPGAGPKRPEVVHQVLTGSCLANPLRELKQT